MSITKQTRRESLEHVMNNLGEKQLFVYISLEEMKNGATAKELAVKMHSDKLVASPERNSVHPRLNELIKKDLVKVVGKKKCDFTNRNVAIYKIKEG